MSLASDEHQNSAELELQTNRKNMLIFSLYKKTSRSSIFREII
jgi:hypothetical protein